MELTINTSRGEITINDSMVVNINSWEPFDPNNRFGFSNGNYGVRPWVIGGEFEPIAIVFARHASEAFDEAVDGDKLDSYMIEDHACEEDCEALHAGNAGEAFDQSYLWIEAINNPRLSFVACLAAS